MYPAGIAHVDYNICITFKSNKSVCISSNTEQTNANVLVSTSINMNTSTMSQNPIGVVSANTLSLDIDSRDMSLDPTNSSSPYFGEMDSSAWATISFTDTDGTVMLGTFYVNSWKPSITNLQPHRITIQLVDLMSKISKMAVPMVKQGYMPTLKQYIIAVITALNEELPPEQQIKYRASDISFGPFELFYYEQLDTTSMSNMLNTLCQSTLVNIYIDAEGYFKVDSLLDDTSAESVMNISGDDYTFSATLAPTSWIDYPDVRVSYIPRRLIPSTELASLSNIVLNPGTNVLPSMTSQQGIFSIDAVALTVKDTTNADAYVSKISSDRSNINIEVVYNGLSSCTADISIIGTVAAADVVVLNPEITGSVLEAKNPILDQSSITQFLVGMRKIIKNKQKAITLTGWYNPRLALGDLVHVTLGGQLNIYNYYKIVGIQLQLSSATLRYTLTLNPATLA